MERSEPAGVFFVYNQRCRYGFSENFFFCVPLCGNLINAQNKKKVEIILD